MIGEGGTRVAALHHRWPSCALAAVAALRLTLRLCALATQPQQVQVVAEPCMAAWVEA